MVGFFITLFVAAGLFAQFIQSFLKQGSTLAHSDERNKYADWLCWWLLIQSVFALVNLGDRYDTVWCRVVCSSFILLPLIGIRKGPPNGFLIYDLWGKELRYKGEGPHFSLWFLGETTFPFEAKKDRLSSRLRAEQKAERKDNAQAVQTPVELILRTKEFPTQASIEGGELRSTPGVFSTTGAQVSVPYDGDIWVVLPLVYRRQSQTLLSEEIGAIGNSLDIFYSDCGTRLTYEELKALQGQGDIALYVNSEIFFTAMKTWREAEPTLRPEIALARFRKGSAALPVAHQVLDAVTREPRSWSAIPPNLTAAIAAYDSRKIVEIVTKDYPGSVQAGLIHNRGVFFIQLSIESFNEDKRITDQRAAAQAAQLAITTQKREAEGEGQKLGSTAYVATEAALGKRPYDGEDYDQLTDSQRARVDRWDAALRRAYSRLLDREVYRTTNATVFNEGQRRRGPQATIALPLGGTKKAPEQQTPPTDTSDPTGTP